MQDGNLRKDEWSILEFFFSLHTTPHPLAGLGFLHPLPFAGLKVDGMLLDFFDDRFLLDSSFKAFQRAFERFTFFNKDKRQTIHLLTYGKAWNLYPNRRLKSSRNPIGPGALVILFLAAPESEAQAERPFGGRRRLIRVPVRVGLGKAIVFNPQDVPAGEHKLPGRPADLEFVAEADMD